MWEERHLTARGSAGHHGPSPRLAHPFLGHRGQKCTLIPTTCFVCSISVFLTSNTPSSAKMATLIAWIKKACLCGRRRVETDDKADSDETNTAIVEDTAELVDKADVASTNGAVEEAPSRNGIQRATDVLGQQVEKEQKHHHRHSRQMPLSWESAGIEPLVAAHANHSPINRLPDELVLQIILCLANDQLTMLCLRRVARRFRRIIDDPQIWKVTRVDYMFLYCGSISERVELFPKDLREELWRRIQKDGMCETCRMLRPSAPANPDAGWLQCPLECPFMSRSPLGLHCDGCSSAGGYDGHPCLGRHGAVRLCEHVKVSWADMEPYLSEWQQQKYHNGKTCLDGFSAECHDPSHDTRCRAEDHPTWPRASLKTTIKYGIPEWVVFLALEWTPHSGPDVFSLTSDRRAPASEVRTMFQRYRQGAADILVSSFPQLPFPEMACFGDTQCQCLDYEEGGDQRSSTASTPKPIQETVFWGSRDLESHRDASHIHLRLHGAYMSSELAAIRRHLPGIKNDSPCIVTHYSRHITVCTRVSGHNAAAVTPANDWYHAADPDLSPPQRSPNIPCRDKSCINYYRSPASFACLPWSVFRSRRTRHKSEST
jgi:hypothetical protein